MTQTETLRLALEALENSVDLVREDAYNAEELYGNYPARQGKVRGLKVLADDHEKAITAIKAALEAKDEPVANNWSVFNTGAEVWDNLCLADAVVELTPSRLERGWSAVCVINKDNPPLYTTPPQRKPLTDEEILTYRHMIDWTAEWSYINFARAIEAKLKELNG
jgi:hypothetical protein